jgi:hypothetical protein
MAICRLDSPALAIELDKPVKVVLTKDDKGAEHRWAVITVGKASPDAEVNPPKKADKK